MKKKIQEMAVRIIEAIRKNPVEVILSVICCTIGLLHYENQIQNTTVLFYFPVLFIIAYILNYLTRNGQIRWMYYLSAFIFIPLLFVEGRIVPVIYNVSLAVSVLAYLVCSRKKENLPFVVNGLSFLQSVCSAFVLALTIFLLTLSIYFSIRYIFEILGNQESRVTTYAAYISFMLVMPLLFLMFNQYERKEYAIGKAVHVLLNYVLSPALLIYAVILYLYFIKVTILWSLPKGAVAYIVISFVTTALILRGCQPLLKRRYYDWFYNRISLFVLPALSMYWVGTIYRINQYGFTELRIYLIILGGFLTLCTCMFFSNRWGRYLYMGYCAISLLTVFTYIPGISAKSLGVISQSHRIEKAAIALGIYTTDGKISTKNTPGTEQSKADYRTLYQALQYIQSEESELYMEKHFGLSTQNLLDSVIPVRFHDYVMYGYEENQYQRTYFQLYNRKAMDIKGYCTLQRIESYSYDKNITPYCEKKGDSIFVWEKEGKLLLKEDKNTLITNQLKKIGIQSMEGITENSLQKCDSRFFQVEIDSLLFILGQVSFTNDSVLKVSDIDIDYYLTPCKE